MTSGGCRIDLLGASSICPHLKAGTMVLVLFTVLQPSQVVAQSDRNSALSGEPRSRWWCTDDGAKATVCHHSFQKTINQRELLHPLLSSCALIPATSNFGPLMLHLLGPPGAGWVGVPFDVSSPHSHSWPHHNGVSRLAAHGTSTCSANAKSTKVSLSLSLSV